MEYSIVHHTPGRVRYRIPQLANDPEMAENLYNLFSGEEYVTDVRIRAFVGSVVVNYQSESLSQETICSYLENLIQISDTVFPGKINKKSQG
ncbi:HMA2 domain-containing protein [Gloeothece citriformis]|uniref:HMA2 domain-containing protein n=1 Tax=Gloeothece citriformis TaxID=2546356 RepID=UPI000173B451|nr:hypothetical protein [Gloeothece citriformis]